VTDRQASILSNVLAMALTLAGPRLWIIIKEFACYLCQYLYDFFRGTRFWSNGPESHNIEIVRESRSQLGAARELIRGTSRQLNPSRIELRDESLDRSRGHHDSGNPRPWHYIRRIWDNLLWQPIDVLVSIILSAMFIGIFVAEASGNALSANIISDTTAIPSTSRCYAPRERNWELKARAASYSDQCYGAAEGADGCNFLYSQKIAYTELANNFCPFAQHYCALPSEPAYTFDTGYVDARHVGINSLNKYFFRRTTICAPVTSEAWCMSYRSGHESPEDYNVSKPTNLYPTCRNKEKTYAASEAGILHQSV